MNNHVNKVGVIVVVPACHEAPMTKDDHDYPYAFLTYYIDLKN